MAEFTQLRNSLRGFRKIEDDYPIASLFNRVMRKLESLRVFCVPDSFHEPESVSDFQDRAFCNFCRYELWMHGVVDKLIGITEVIDEYLTEFGGSWKYYAASSRLRSISEFGADDEDLDDDGSIRTEGLTDEDYSPYTVINDIYDETSRDIAFDTFPQDIGGMCGDLIAQSSISMPDIMRRSFGAEVRIFKQDSENGFREVTREEHELDMAMGKVKADDDVKLIRGVASSLFGIREMVKGCEPYADNVELLTMIRDASLSVLNMDFETIGTILRVFCDKYEKGEGHEMGSGGV